MTRAELIQYITDNVYPNARNEVTAPMVRDSLLEIVDFLGDAATYNIGMVASGNQGLVTGGNVNTAIALALLPYYTAAETGQAIDDAIARIGLGQAAYKNIGQVAENNTDLVTGGQVYTAINTALTSAIKFQGISDTPLTDGSTTNPIQINGQSYTAKKGDMVVYGGNEYLWVGNKWQQMGDESSYALKTIQITGTGYLTGGGDLTQSRTLDISATAKSYIDHGEAAYNYFPGGVLGSTHLPSMYIGTTSVQFTAAAQNLTGISSVRATTNVMTLFEWDSTNSAWHFHGNIYTDGWFSGGGISPGGGGGGGGIDPVAMWRLLTNDPSLTQYDDYTKISADHINFPVTSVVGLTGAITKQQIAQALELGSLAYKNSLSVSDIPDLSETYLPRSAGSGKPLTGGLYLNAGAYLERGGDLVFKPTSGNDTGDIVWYYYNGNEKMRIWSDNTYSDAAGPNYRVFSSDGTQLNSGTLVTSWQLTNNLANYLPIAGGTMTGPITNDTSRIWKNSSDTAYLAYVSQNVYLRTENAVYLEAPAVYHRTLGGTDYTIWDSGNDGSGSGLDADLLDGIHESGFARNLGAIAPSNTDAWRFLGYGSAGDGWVTYGSIIGFGLNAQNYSQIQTDNGSNDIYFRTITQGTAASWSKIWHQGNDGPGSGLDADTLDGFHWNNFAYRGSLPSYDTDPKLTSVVSGIYQTMANRQDMPVDHYGSMVLHCVWDINAATELFMRYDSDQFFYRRKDSNVWQAWRKVALYDDNVSFGSGNFTSNITCGQMTITPGGVVSGNAGQVFFYGNFHVDCVGTNDLYVNYYSSRNVFICSGGGNVSIGYAGDHGEKLYVSGVISASTGIYTDGWFSGGGVASSSDMRLKKNIKNFAYTPKLLLSIRPREWDWKDGSAMVGHAAGFVAQEIEPIMPYAVDGTRNFKALFYDRFHALEIAGLQDHERRIVELERAVKERDAKIEKLEKMLKLN